MLFLLITVWTAFVTCTSHVTVVCNFQVLSVYTVKYAPPENERNKKNLLTVQVDRLSAYKLSTCQIDRLAC